MTLKCHCNVIVDFILNKISHKTNVFGKYYICPTQNIRKFLNFRHCITSKQWKQTLQWVWIKLIIFTSWFFVGHYGTAWTNRYTVPNFYTVWFKRLCTNLRNLWGWNINFTIGTHSLRSNPDPVQGCECMHPSAKYSLPLHDLVLTKELFWRTWLLLKNVIGLYGSLYMLLKFVRNLLNHRPPLWAKR